jgi:RHS repeat-associated protein
MTADDRNNYLYDAEGRVCAVQVPPTPYVGGPTQLYQYIYDADGNRIAKGSIASFSCDDTANGFTLTNSYVLGQGGEQVTEMVIANGQAGWAHTNGTVGGMLLATSDTQGLQFQLTDWLGTKRVQTNAFGQVEETCANPPFGNTLLGTTLCSSPANAPHSADDATEHHFTGKERDNESGLDYFGARYYASNMGRFMSPDWSKYPAAVPYSSLGDPQTLNLYSYVGNNPLRRVDRDGHHQQCGAQTSSTDPTTGVLTVNANCHDVPDWWQFQGARRLLEGTRRP